MALFLKVLPILLLPGCFMAHQDDVLPTPVVNTPVTPNPALINTVSRALHKVHLTIELAEGGSCLLGYSMRQMTFQLIRHEKPVGTLIKTVSPVKQRFSFITRLQDHGKHEARLILDRDGRVLDQKSFRADQQDRIIPLTVPCRDGA